MGEVIVGREAELDTVDRFIDATRRRPAFLLLEGEAGIGKTTLWQAAIRRAGERGVRILSSRPGPSETRLTYAGLLDLLGMVDEAILGELPTPQRRALEIALLRAEAEGPSADQRSIATGFLSVLRILCRSAPVLVAVDDIQWLDLPSRRVLDFAGRRLENERVGVLAAVRIDKDGRRGSIAEAFPRDRLARVRLGPLNLAALHEMLRSALGQAFVRPTLVRIERASAGNPFFALELARAILESGEPVPASGALAVPEDLLELITRRLHRLPASSLHALLVASALSQPTREMLDPKALARAEEAGVVRVDDRGRVTFAHPLLASAVYGSAGIGVQREVHRALALRVTDSEERARHLALATDGPSEEVASALVGAARSARERGAPDAAIELIELACELTPTDLRDALFVRRFELGSVLSTAGDPQRAKSVLREITEHAPPGRLRTRALLMLSFVIDWTEGGESATALCEDALLDTGMDRDLQAEIHAAASRMCDHDPERKAFHARAALNVLGGGTAEPALRAYALLAFAEAEFYGGRGILYDVFEQAAALESVSPPAKTVDSAQRITQTMHLYSDIKPSSRLLGILRLYADDLGPARTEFQRDRRFSIENGDEAQLARALGRLMTLELRVGDWDASERYLHEMVNVVQRTGQDVATQWSLLLRAQLDARRGRLDTARAAADEAFAMAAAAGWRWQTVESSAVLGFVELTSGNLAAAREHLDRADAGYRQMGLKDPGFIRYQADHVESLIGVGELASATAALERFEAQARPLGRPLALATAARCRGLLQAARGDLEGASATLETACNEHSRVTSPFELARTLLVKGQVHRRRKEKLLARDTLTRALEIFEKLGSPIWADRARAELRRIGLARSRADQLTSTEQQVATLAASGLTNRAVAERAFISPKTVETNLARVYQKLGIHSRAELGRAMAQRERAAAE